jgi:AraC-like DNA-binding protein
MPPSAAATAPRLFRSVDLDEARAELSRVYYPLRVAPAGSGQAFALSMRTVSLGSITVGRLLYGGDITKDCGELHTAYHINAPVAGEVVSTCGDQQVVATPSRAAIFGPTGRTVLDLWRAGSDQLCIKIDRRRLEGDLAERLERPLREPVRFRMGMDLTAPMGQSWLRAVHILATELETPGGLASQPLLAAEIERLIVDGLLWGQHHNYAESMRQPGRPPQPRTVRLAIELIESDPATSWSITELARAVGVSVRSLENGFRRYLGTTPLAYLHSCRLDRAHDDLRRSSIAETTVTDVAFRWGFSHLGRFARAYRERFGVNPSETLRLAGP